MNHALPTGKPGGIPSYQWIIPVWLLRVSLAKQMGGISQSRALPATTSGAYQQAEFIGMVLGATYFEDGCSAYAATKPDQSSHQTS